MRTRVARGSIASGTAAPSAAGKSMFEHQLPLYTMFWFPQLGARHEDASEPATPVRSKSSVRLNAVSWKSWSRGRVTGSVEVNPRMTTPRRAGTDLF